MRVSIDENDPGYGPDARHARVFLDGVELKGCCLTADEEQGICVCYAQDADGHPVADGDRVKLETRCGVVRIVLPDWSSA